MANEFYTYPNESFSGCDMVSTFIVPDVKDSTNYHIYAIGELQTISYSIHMERKSVRAIGNINAKDYVLGPRTIAGTLIFTVFNKHFAKNIIDDINNNLDSKYAFLADELPPFHIIISLANEYGVKAKLVIYGVRLINEGQVMSINDIYTENTYQFVATDIEYLDNENNYISNAVQNRILYKLDDSGQYDTRTVPDYSSNDEDNNDIIPYYEKVELSYDKISDAYENKNGKVRLFVKPVKDYGYIKIASTDYNIELNLNLIKQGETGILVELPEGAYSAVWYCDTATSNQIKFYIKKIILNKNIEYVEPIVEFITEYTCNILVNNNVHNYIVYTELNTGTKYKIKLSGKRVSIYDLSPNSYYEIASCNEDMTSISKPVTILTLAFGYDLYQNFMEYIIYNINNMTYPLNVYYKVVMDSKELYYKNSQKNRYNSISETFKDILKKYNAYLASLKSIDFPIKSYYQEEVETYTELATATKEIIAISNKITNDKVYGYNREFIVVNPPILETSNFCTNNLLVDNNVEAVVFFRIINNNTTQYVRTINKRNFVYYNENMKLCNFNDKPNSYYYAYAVNQYGFKSNRVCFYTLSYEEKSKALEEYYENNSYLNYIINKNTSGNDLNAINSLSDTDKKILALEIEKDSANSIVNIPYINIMNVEGIIFNLKHHSKLLIDNNCMIVLSDLNNSVLNSVKYKQKITADRMNFSCLDYGFKKNEVYMIWLENEDGKQISNSLSFIFNGDNKSLNEYYTTLKINQLQQVFKNNKISNEIINNIFLSELSNLDNTKYNILDNIFCDILSNAKNIVDIDNILYVFLNYYYSQFNITDINSLYEIKYNINNRKLSIDVNSCYAVINELSDEINTYYIDNKTTIDLSIKNKYVINFISKDLTKESNFILINPLTKKVYNNIKIEVI